MPIFWLRRLDLNQRPSGYELLILRFTESYRVTPTPENRHFLLSINQLLRNIFCSGCCQRCCHFLFFNRNKSLEQYSPFNYNNITFPPPLWRHFSYFGLNIFPKPFHLKAWHKYNLSFQGIRLFRHR